MRLEQQVDERVEELTRIRVELKRHEMLVNEQTLTIQSILSERDSLANEVRELQRANSELSKTLP